MKYEVVIPKQAVPAPSSGAGRSRFWRRRDRQQYVIDRLHETKNGEVHATAVLPDGSVKVWGEGDQSRPLSSLRAYNEGWERAFGARR